MSGARARPAKLGFWMTTALVMGSMIGSGVFLTPAALAPYGWNAVVGWVATIGGALTLAYLLARLTRAVPGAADAVGLMRHVFGPVPSFMITWSYWVSVWTANVTLAVAAVSNLGVFTPGLAALPFGPALAALALLWTITLVNLRGARVAGGVQIVTLVIKIIPLVVVAALIAGVLARNGPAPVLPWPAEGLSVAAIGASATLTLWPLLGFESASVAGEKVERREVTVPRAMLVGTALTGLLYLVVCSGIALLLPPTVAAGSSAPFATFVESYWARTPGLFMAAFAGIAALGALNGWVLLQGQTPLAMARAGLLPAWIGRTDARDTPVRALLVSSLLASLLLAANASSSTVGMFTFMSLLSTSATLWLYLAIAIAALRLRLAPPLALLATAYALWALWGAGLTVSLLSLVLMAGGLPFYWAARRSGAAAQASE